MDLTALIGISIWDVAKVFVLVAVGVYVIFAFVVVRQVNLMTKTLEFGYESVLRLIAMLHFVLSLGVFVFALLIL